MALDSATARPPGPPICVACGGALRLFGPRRNFEYHQCRSCGTLQLYPQPNEAELRRAYETDYAEANQAAEFHDPERWIKAGQPYRRAILRTLQRWNVHGEVIDFGAGWGFLTKLLREQGFACQGLEPSRQMAAYAERNGIPVRAGDRRSLGELDCAVAAIVLCATFEHLVGHEEHLGAFRQALRPGGLVVSLHPTTAFYTAFGLLLRLGQRERELPELHGSFAPPWHTALFSISAMGLMAERNGFDLAEVHPAPQGRIGGLFGAAQIGLEAVNRAGWAVAGERWPLVTTHIFVLKKR